MSDGVKLPVIETVKLSVRWTVAVLVKHWLLMVAFVVLSAIILLPLQLIILPDASRIHTHSPNQIVNFPSIILIITSVIAYIVFIMPPTLITYNEILRGAAGLDSATLGRYGSRIFMYIIDSLFLLLILFAILLLFIPVFIVISFIINNTKNMEELIGIGSMIALGLVLVSCALRLSLRLPSRAVGDVLPWRAAWELGRGNTFRLFLAQVIFYLILLVLALPSFALQVWLQGGLIPSHPPAFLPGLIIFVIGDLIFIVQIVFICAFQSVAYAYLRNARPEPVRAEPRF